MSALYTTEPNYVLDVTETDQAVADYDYKISYNQVNLSKGFSVITGTLTATDIKIFVYNKDSVLVDMTQDFVGAATLPQNSCSLVDIPAPVKGVVIRVTPTNVVNAVAFTAFFAKR